MKGVSPVVATVLLVAVAIAAAVGFYAWTEATMSSTQSTASAQANKVFTLPLTVEAAQMTTPYTWNIIVRNPNGVDVDANQLMLYVKDAKGDICAVSSGVVGGSIPAQSVERLTFYGWNKCEIPANSEEWKLTLSAGGYKSEYAVPVSSSSMGLVLWMPFDDVWKFDKSGNNLDVHYYDEEFQGTVNGLSNGTLMDANTSNGDGDTPPKWVKGHKGYGLEFDGVDDYVSVTGIDLTSNPEENATVCMWFYWDPDITNSAWKNNWMLFSWSTGYDIWYSSGLIGINTGRGEKLGFPWNEPKRWEFVCVMFPNDYPDRNADAVIWLNGERKTLTFDKSAVNSKNLSTTAYIGGSTSHTAYVFPGIIDDVRIYDRALTDKEVKELYEGKDVRDGLVLYLPFDEGTGTTAWDWHNWSKEGLWLDGKYDGTVVNYVSGIGGLPSTITTPYTMVAEANVSKPNDALITRTTSHSTIWLGSEGYRPCISIDYNYNDGVDPLDLCINDINMFQKDCRLAAEYTPPNGPARICARCGEKIECNSVDTYNYGNPDAAQNSSGLSIGAIWSKDTVDNLRGYLREVRYYSRALTEGELKCIVNNGDCLIDDKNLVVMYTFQEPCRTGPTDLSTNKVCRAPKIVEVNGLEGVEFDDNTTAHYFWTDPDEGKIRNDFTVFAAFDTNNTQKAYIIRKNNDADGFYNYFIHTISGKLRAGIWDGSNFPDVRGTKIVNDSKIHATAFERTAHKEIALYTDGQLDENATDTTTGSITGSAPVQIGYIYDEYFWGHMYSIFLLEKTLDRQTISALCKLFKAC